MSELTLSLSANRRMGCWLFVAVNTAATISFNPRFTNLQICGQSQKAPCMIMHAVHFLGSQSLRSSGEVSDSEPFQILQPKSLQRSALCCLSAPELPVAHRPWLATAGNSEGSFSILISERWFPRLWGRAAHSSHRKLGNLSWSCWYFDSQVRHGW